MLLTTDNRARALSLLRNPISKSNSPAFILQTQKETAPFPFPIRICNGFVVTGVVGLTRIQILSFFFKLLESIRLEASNCFEVKRLFFKTFKPKKPKAIEFEF